MSEHKNQDRRPGGVSGPPEKPSRRPYERPGIISREVWEAVAGVCSGAGTKATRPPCFGPLSS